MKIRTTLAILAGLTFATTSVVAQDFYKDIYLGIKLGPGFHDQDAYAAPVDPSTGGTTTYYPNFDRTVNFSALIGYEITDNIAIEGELSTSAGQGQINGYQQTLVDGVSTSISIEQPASSAWDLTTGGIYGAYRFGGDLYLKARAGIAYNDVSPTLPTYYPMPGDQIDFAAGLGAGWKFTKLLSLEADYTYLNSETSYMGAGLNISY